MNFCPFKKFKNIFGTPKKGVHQFRLLNSPIVDYILTILLSFLTTYLTHIPLTLTTILWFIVSIMAHMLFGVQTDALDYLGIGC